MSSLKIILPCAKGSEQVLENEAKKIGLLELSVRPAAVIGTGDLDSLYRLCLWSRIASRVLLVIQEGKIDSPDDLYDLAKMIPWDDHISPKDTFAVRFTGSGNGIRNTQFGALKVKDAIVDYLRDVYHSRPDVDNKNPDISIDVHLHRDNITISLDFSGGGLHERGYRQAQGAAPIKETLAATMLYRSAFDEQKVPAVIDPMCGSGTLLCEALMIAADIAPALNRKHWGFLKWQSHKPAVWKKIQEEAIERKAEGLKQLDTQFYGYDSDESILKMARENALRLGINNLIRFEEKDVKELKFDSSYGDTGLIITNPPYGERLGSPMDLVKLYAQLGNAFKSFPENWKLSLVSSDPALIQRLRLRSDKQYQAFNGALEVRIMTYLRGNQPASDVYHEGDIPLFSEAAQMFANRLQKNIKKYKSQAKKLKTNAYRVYDQDMPEYAVAIDLYDNEIVMQEYTAPKTIDPDKAQKRLYDIFQVVGSVFDIDPDHIIFKKRQRQQGNAQYSALDKKNQYTVVQEGNAYFYVNLHDYLDTGLFLDHRAMRRRLYQEAKDKRVLNLFCYTATATVQAALGGATYTTSIDLSQNYLDWAQKNFELNDLSTRHRLQKADVMEWLETGNSEFDLIFCDPPTFSNTKKKERVFDVQDDHLTLIKRCMKRLVPRGTLYFSNNFRSFKMDGAVSDIFSVEEISANTLDFDFKRRPKIHRVWKIQHKE